MGTERRGLTPAEVALAREAFDGRLPYADIAFVNGAGGNPLAAMAIRNGNSAITLKRTIYFNGAYWRSDFSVGKAAAKGLLIHELTHVLQYQEMGTGWFLARYAREYAGCGFQAWRMYEYEEGRTGFPGARLEAQAQMAGDYAEARADGDHNRIALVARNLAGSSLFGL